MKNAIAALLLVFAGAACNSDTSVKMLAKCEHDLGAADAQIAQAQAAQAAAERNLTATQQRLTEAEARVASLERARPSEAPAPATATAAVEASPPPPAPTKAAPPPAKAVKRGEHALRFGLALPARRERWIKDQLTMLGEAKKRGIEFLVQVSEDDAARQETQCDDLISQGIDVLILAPVNGQAAGSIVAKAVKAGVKVISYERLVMASPDDYVYVGFDGLFAGGLQGDFLARRAPKGNYLVVTGPQTDNNAKLFREGALKYIQPLVNKGDVKVVLDEFAEKWKPEEGQRLCEKALAQAGGTIAAAYVATDGLAGGCIDALEAHGLAGKVPVTGQDAELAAAVRIVGGTQSMTIFKDTRLLAIKAVEVAEQLARKKPVDTRGKAIQNGVRKVPAVLLTGKLVTRANLDQVVIDSGYLKREAVYRQ